MADTKKLNFQNQWLSSTAAASHTVHEYFINLITESGEAVIILEYFLMHVKWLQVLILKNNL